MIDYKQKNFRVKTKKDEIAKLMVLASGKGYSPKRRIDIGTLAIQPMEKKENFENKPEIPLINKITAPDWNVFVDNVEFLNLVEQDNADKVLQLKTEVDLLKANTQFIQARTEPHWIVQDKLFNDYSLVKLFDNFNDNEELNKIMGTPYSKEEFLKIIKDNWKWVIDFQNNEGKIVRNYVFGLPRTIQRTYNDQTVTIYYINNSPLTYLKRITFNGQDRDTDRFLAIPAYVNQVLRLDIANADQARELNLGIILAIVKDTTDPKNVYLFPASSTSLKRRWDNVGRPDVMSDTYQAQPVTAINWRPRNIGYTTEEPVDLFGMTNWMVFILYQLQYNSEFSEKWGKSDEEENETIKQYLANQEANLLSLCDASENPFEIQFYTNSDRMINANFIKSTGQKVQIRATFKTGGTFSSKPSEFFIKILTPESPYVGQLQNTGSDTAPVWKQLINNYMGMYFDLWTNKTHKVADWIWKLEVKQE